MIAASVYFAADWATLARLTSRAGCMRAEAGRRQQAVVAGYANSCMAGYGDLYALALVLRSA